VGFKLQKRLKLLGNVDLLSDMDRFFGFIPLITLVFTSGCGVKGAPLPPIVVVPAKSDRQELPLKPENQGHPNIIDSQVNPSVPRGAQLE
jgi:hypothetical protein